MEEIVGEFVDLEVSRSGVATIRLDRPKVNALNRRVVAEIGAAVEEVRSDDDAKAAVVWGGEKVLAAGASSRSHATFGSARRTRSSVNQRSPSASSPVPAERSGSPG